MKIAFGGLNLAEGKIKYNDEILVSLAEKFQPKKVSPYFFEFLREGYEHADAIVMAKASLLDLLILDIEKIEKRIENSEDESEKTALRLALEGLEKETPLCDVVFPDDAKKHIAALSPFSLKATLVEESASPDVNLICRDAMAKAGRMFFYTAGKQEVRAWFVPSGSDAVTCAGKIHSDLARGFIKAEIVPFDDLMKAHNFQDAAARGLTKLVDKNYIIPEKTVLEIRFNV